MNPLLGAAAAMPSFSASSLFSVYASLTAFVTLIQQFYYQFVPSQVRIFISQKLKEWFAKARPSSELSTLIIEQYQDDSHHPHNQVYHACEAYLASKPKSASSRLKVSRTSKKSDISFKLAEGETYSEHFEDVEIRWSLIFNDASDNAAQGQTNRSFPARPGSKYFEISFDRDHKDKVYESYLPFILKYYDEMVEKKKDLKLFSLQYNNVKLDWRGVVFKHPFTFDVLAMEPEVKRALIDDLDRFIKRREFYKKVGRAWKRGYLLYGPPGTGKSSLIAAMANYLRFDIYDLQLSSVLNDTELRTVLLSTQNKSILVVEDIDCSLGLAARQVQPLAEGKNTTNNDIDAGSKISLSGLLNFIDGLWSTCGDERIFIFTTNHKDKLDPALLRPGRMDMHMHMSYLTMPSFRVLASSYLNNLEEHHLFREIEELIQATKVTPAQVAEELIRSDDADIALSGLVKMLKEKKLNQSEVKSSSDSRKKKMMKVLKGI